MNDKIRADVKLQMMGIMIMVYGIFIIIAFVMQAVYAAPWILFLFAGFGMVVLFIVYFIKMKVYKPREHTRRIKE